MTSLMPMAAMFSRNKFIGWYVEALALGICPRSLAGLWLGGWRSRPIASRGMCDATARHGGGDAGDAELTCGGFYRAAVVFSIQTWLGESEDTRKNSSTPGYLNVGLAGMRASHNPESHVLRGQMALVQPNIEQRKIC